MPSRSAISLALQPLGQLPIVSPWSTGQLARIAVADLFGVRSDEISRGMAMQDPAVARARGLIIGHLARLPLTLWEVGDHITPTPATAPPDVRLPTPRWLSSTNTAQSPRARLGWTLDDLLFYGLSLWAVERDDSGAITDAIRVDQANWSTDPDTLGILINGELVTDPASVILFEGAQEGLLTIASAEIRGALDMSAAWRQRVAAPVPLVELHETDPNIELEPTEVDELIAGWEAARQQGGTAFTPSHIQAIMHGDVQSDLYVEGRNAHRLDIANYTQVPSNLLEGSMSTASLTYSTQEGRRSDFVDTCLVYWGGQMESRLSMDDVTPDGTAVRFDFTSLNTATAPAFTVSTED